MQKFGKLLAFAFTVGCLASLSGQMGAAAQTAPWEQLSDGSSGQVTEFRRVGGVTIAAYIRKPAGEGSFSVVIMLHGGEHSAQGTYGLGRSVLPPVVNYVQSGWAVYAMDFRADPSPGQAIGDEWEWQDAVAGIETAEKYLFVDSKRVALIGQCYGTNVLSRVVSRVDAQAAVMCAPAAYTYGNDSRTEPQVYGPGDFNMNFLLSKQVHFTERWWGEIRCQANNAFNHFNPGNPNTADGNPNFGIITGGGGGRSMVLSIRLHF
jgi:hypothetical protein